MIKIHSVPTYHIDCDEHGFQNLRRYFHGLNHDTALANHKPEMHFGIPVHLNDCPAVPKQLNEPLNDLMVIE